MKHLRQNRGKRVMLIPLFLMLITKQSWGCMDTHLLTANTKSDSISLIDLATQSVCETIQIEGGPREVVTADQKVWLTLSQKNKVVCLDIPQRKITQEVTFKGEVRGLSVGSANSSFVGVLKDTDQIFQYDSKTQYGLTTHASLVQPTVMGPRQTLVAEAGIWVSGNTANQIALHHKDSLEMIQVVSVPKNPYALCALDLHRIALGSIGENMLAIVDTQSGKVSQTVSDLKHPTSLLTVGNKQLWATSFDDHCLVVYDLKTMKGEARIPNIPNPFCLCQSQDHIWCTSHQAGKVFGINKQSLSVEHEISVGEEPHHLCLQNFSTVK